jgi:CRISPR-associated protein Csd1
MMLQALMAYAEREGLGDADFKKVGVRWLVPIDTAGKFTTTLIPLSDDPSAKKLKPKKLIRPNSDPDFVAHGKSYFLCDTLERSLLFVEDPSKRKKRCINQAYFISLLEDAAKACPDSANSLRSLVMFLRNPNELARVHRAFAEVNAKGSDNAAFSVNGLELLKSEELQNYWRTRCAAERGKQDAENGVCLTTGKLGPICRTTHFIKLLGEDTKLISFNKECPAFESFGFAQASNAPVGLDAEIKFCAAFNKLIEISYEQKLVFNNTIHLHWTRTPVDFDPLDPIVSGDPDAIARLLRSVQDGHRVRGIDANDYYAISLSGNGARIVVRDWLESTVPEVERHVAEWFKDISIISPEGTGIKCEFKFGALLYGMVRAELDELPPQVSTQLFQGALRGHAVPLPQSALVAAVRRQQLDQENKLNPARMAIIKVCLLRSPNRKESDTMTECLSPDSRDPAYLCGRLFATFDRLQYLALGNVNAGVVERYYASASTTPALVMGRLFRNAQFHLAKSDDGVAENVRKDFESITCALGDNFPSSLTLEEQGRFALGYYHQKAEYRRRSAERKESIHTAKAADSAKSV